MQGAPCLLVVSAFRCGVSFTSSSWVSTEGLALCWLRGPKDEQKWPLISEDEKARWKWHLNRVLESGWGRANQMKTRRAFQTDRQYEQRPPGVRRLGITALLNVSGATGRGWRWDGQVGRANLRRAYISVKRFGLILKAWRRGQTSVIEDMSAGGRGWRVATCPCTLAAGQQLGWRIKFFQVFTSKLNWGCSGQSRALLQNCQESKGALGNTQGDNRIGSFISG